LAFVSDFYYFKTKFCTVIHYYYTVIYSDILKSIDSINILFYIGYAADLLFLLPSFKSTAQYFCKIYPFAQC